MPIASDARKNGSGASSGIAAQLIKNYSCTKETRTVENWPVKVGYFICCGPQDLDSSSAQTFTHCSVVGPGIFVASLHIVEGLIIIRNRTGLGTIDALPDLACRRQLSNACYQINHVTRLYFIRK